LEMPLAGDDKMKSKVQKKTNNPEFGDVLTFQSVSGKDCSLLVSVFHKNFLAADFQVGQATVARHEVYGAGAGEATYGLTSTGGLTTGKQVGSVTLRILAT